MACDGAKQPLLSGLVDPIFQTNKENPPKGRRFRRCKSAPLTEFAAPFVNGNDSLPHSGTTFGKLHPSIKQVSVYLAIYLSVGTMCFYIVRDQIDGKKTTGMLDSLYFCVVTMTTVGYGDLVPDSVFTKLLASVFAFTGMGLVGLILGKAADYLVEKQEILLVRALHPGQKVGPTGILKEIETNGVKYKFSLVSIVLSVLISVGTIFLSLFEKFNFVDAFYCVCATVTTLGYGDKTFSSTMGRFFAVFWILTSTVCLGQFFFCITEMKTEKRQKALVKWVLNKKVTNEDLEAADFDDNGVVGAAEFILYKLKEMGKITQEDISLVMEEFHDLDVDQSGTLSASDINLAQSTEIKK